MAVLLPCNGTLPRITCTGQATKSSSVTIASHNTDKAESLFDPFEMLNNFPSLALSKQAYFMWILSIKGSPIDVVRCQNNNELNYQFIYQFLGVQILSEGKFHFADSKSKFDACTESEILHEIPGMSTAVIPAVLLKTLRHFSPLYVTYANLSLCRNYELMRNSLK